MRAKPLLVSFLTLVAVLTIVGIVAAADFEDVVIEVEDIVVYDNGAVGNNVSIVAGETVEVEVTFKSNVFAEDVEITAELDGQGDDIEETSAPFDVETRRTYRKVLILEVPSDLDDDDLSDFYDLTIEIQGDSVDDANPGRVEFDEEVAKLRVQKESFKLDIKSVSTLQNVDAGQTLPVDIVLKNVGYNDLDDLYVTASIPALGVQRTAYFEDIVAIECDDDDDVMIGNVTLDRNCDDDEEDSAFGRILLQIPDDAPAGIYTIEVKASNDDATETATAQVVIENEFATGSDVIATATGKTVAAGESAEYSILIVNPTNKLKVYRVIPEATSDLSVSAVESVVAVPAGSSKTVKVMASSDTEGTYAFNVNVFSGEELIKTVTLNANVEGRSSSIGGTANPVTVLTVILAIIFIVLLIVLFVLVGKKPEKTEEFGESYY